jgi:large subunit ribosomal protein L4
MLKIQKFTIKGVKGEDVSLPKEFDVKINLPLLSQAVHVYEEKSHVGLRNTKTRSEVNRTTKKVYKQKGTGGARHGSRRANLFVGGGVIFGPRPLKRILNLPNKLKVQAKYIAYAMKAKEGRMIMAAGLSKVEKTKAVSELIIALEKVTKAKKFTFVLSDEAKTATRYINNLAKAKSISYRNANVYDIFTGGMIVIDEGIIETNKENKAVKTVEPVKKVVAKKVAVKKTIKK